MRTESTASQVLESSFVVHLLCPKQGPEERGGSTSLRTLHRRSQADSRACSPDICSSGRRQRPETIVDAFRVCNAGTVHSIAPIQVERVSARLPILLSTYRGSSGGWGPVIQESSVHLRTGVYQFRQMTENRASHCLFVPNH